jgi:hypothetical protein
LFEADDDCRLDRWAAAASIQAAIYNTHNDWDKRPEGWTAADFMPGAVIQTEEDRLIEFAERVMAGDSFEDGAPDPEEMDEFRRTVTKTFNNVR